MVLKRYKVDYTHVNGEKRQLTAHAITADRARQRAKSRLLDLVNTIDCVTEIGPLCSQEK